MPQCTCRVECDPEARQPSKVISREIEASMRRLAEMEREAK